jgi:cytochrome c biogenesis protein CcdA
MGEVLLFTLTATANPTLIAVTTLMLLLPNPKKLMLGYLIGAYGMSITLGLVIVFAAENSGVVSSGKQSISPGIDVAVGVILILAGLLLRSDRDRRIRERRAEKKHAKPKKTPRWQTVLTKGSFKVTIVVGALLTLPGASYLAALTGLAKLHYSTALTIVIVILINVIMLALLEVPLICFAVAPDWTPGAIEHVKGFFRAHGRRYLIAGLIGIGALLILRAVIEVLAAS